MIMPYHIHFSIFWRGVTTNLSKKFIRGKLGGYTAYLDCECVTSVYKITLSNLIT